MTEPTINLSPAELITWALSRIREIASEKPSPAQLHRIRQATEFAASCWQKYQAGTLEAYQDDFPF